MSRICYDCEHRVINSEDANKNLELPHQWSCRKDYWQDMSICFECHPEIRNWARRCKFFKERNLD